MSCIKDSGNRREFETGAVRDMPDGKGRCDLMPLDVVSVLTGSPVIERLCAYQEDGDMLNLYDAIALFAEGADFTKTVPILLDVSVHFEEGAKKYGENNWKKGIPTYCYIDSAVRHYLKFLRGDQDEPHDRAFIWNLMCCIWTCTHKPELNTYRRDDVNVQD